MGGLALGAAVLAWLDSRNYESPHFAQVQGRVDLIGARVSGTIAWEGDTLVVDTTNFTDKTGFRGSTPDLHVIERFTRAGDHGLLYRFTIDDPNTWTKPPGPSPGPANIVGRKRTGPFMNTPVTKGITR